MLDSTSPAGRDTATADAATPEVSVVVPHFNDLENLDACLACLTDQTLPRDRYEIIVADNMSAVGFEAVAKVVGDRARLVEAREKGAGPARNEAAAHARAPVLAFTDSDCRPARDWLEKALAASERASVVGGRVEVFSRDAENLTSAEAFETVFGFDNKGYVEKKGFSVTANLIVHRDVFEQAGPYRASVAEDMEWCHRAGSCGHRIVYDDALVVAHPTRKDWAELTKKWDRLSREGYLTMIEQPGGRLKWGARSLAVLASPLPHSLRILRSPALPRRRDRLAAMGVLFRLRTWRFLKAWRLMLGRG